MDSNNIKEQRGPRPVIARKKGKIGAVMIDPKTGKPIPDTWITKAEVPQTALKYLDPEKFSAAEKRNANRQAQIDAEKERLKGVGNSPDTTPKPDSEPATAKPKPAPSRPAPAPTPFGRTMPAPAAADLDKYKINKDWAAANPRLAQAQVARSSGQSRADINKILYKPGTAAYGASGKSEIEKKAQEIRQTRERISKEGIKPIPVSKEETMTKEPYDLVLEYLFSQGHVETLEEALYVMMEMSSKTIQSIVEGVMPEPINPEVHRRLQRIEKATKLQQGTAGAESQSAGSAVKRMGGSGVQLPGV